MALTDNNGGGLSAADVAAVVGSNGYGNISSQPIEMVNASLRFSRPDLNMTY